MRRLFRRAGFIALAAAATTCTDSGNPTKPQASAPARLSVSPRFSADAARAYSALAAGGIEVTEVRVHLTATDGSARDTVINFPPTVSQLLVEIPVAGGQDGQPFTVLLELRNDAHTVLFSGTQTVVAHSAQFSGGTPPVIVVQYTGPGKGTTAVALAPANPTTATAATIPFTAAGVDAAGHAVTDLLVFWTSSDATVATVASTGDATALVTPLGKRGVATITATTPLGVIGTSRVTFVPPPAKVVIVSGGGQTGVAGSVLPLPLVVEVQASDNLPVPGAAVAFSAITAGSTVQQIIAITDASGRASTFLTLGRTAGVYQFDATSGALAPVNATATATPAPAAALALVSGDGQSNSAGLALAQPLVVRVSDQFGAPVAGSIVTWTRLTGSGVPGASSSVSDVNGLASISYTLGSVAGTESVQASLVGVSGPAGTAVFTMTAVNRTPVAIAITSGGNQSGAPGAVLPTPLVATVTDVAGNGVPNVAVAWGASVNGATFAPGTSVTNANGQASTMATLGSAPGPVLVSATVGSLTATTALTIVGPTATRLLLVTQPSSAAKNGVAFAAQPVVQLRDASRNVAQPGVVISVSLATGNGFLANANAVTNDSGVATFSGLAFTGTAANITLSFTSRALTPALSGPIAIAAGGATQLVIATQASPSAQAGAAFAAEPVLQIADVSGNPVARAGVTVLAVIASGGGTLSGVTSVKTNERGVASFTNLAITGTVGVRTLRFQSGSLSSIVSAAINITIGSRSQLTFTTAPASSAKSGASLATQPVIQLRDAGGNAVLTQGVVVSATITTGSGALTHASATSVMNGSVTFSGLTITGTPGSYVLNFSAPGYSPLSSTAIVLSGAADTLFTTSSDHVTQFTGAFPQSINFTNTQSFLSVLRLRNSSVGGAVVLDSARTVNGTAQPRVNVIAGKPTLNSGARFFANGGVVLGSSANLNLLAASNFQSTGSCTGQNSGATITGPGTFNGAPTTATPCP